jgi:hypothetical protein
MAVVDAGALLSVSDEREEKVRALSDRDGPPALGGRGSGGAAEAAPCGDPEESYRFPTTSDRAIPDAESVELRCQVMCAKQVVGLRSGHLPR